MKRKPWIVPVFAVIVVIAIVGGLALNQPASTIEDLLPGAALVSTRVDIEPFPGMAITRMTRTSRTYLVALSDADLLKAIRERGPKLGWKLNPTSPVRLAVKDNAYDFGVNIVRLPAAPEGTVQVIEYVPTSIRDRAVRRWEAYWRHR